MSVDDAFANIYDPFMAGFEALGLRRWRAELLAGLTGDVLELGAGTGLNLPHYGSDVTRLILVEPSEAMRSTLTPRAQARGAEVLSGFAEQLDLPDDVVDNVVFGLVLCSVRDPLAALAEAKRVLRPDGRLVFIEHVIGGAPLRWAHKAAAPLWAAVAGGCRLDRDTASLIEQAGFTIEHIERSWFPGAPGLVPAIRGIARPTSQQDNPLESS